jgi:hypothetical protein
MNGPERAPERVRQVEESFIPRFRDLPDDDIHAEMRRYRPGSAERLVLGRILDKRHRAAAEPEQRRFERTYELTERHQRALRRSAWIAAGVSLIGAAASLASVWFSGDSQTHRLQPPAETATPPAIASPSPTTQEP